MAWFFEHWHTLAAVASVLLVGGYHVLHGVIPAIRKDPPREESLYFLLGTVSIVLVALAIRVEQLGHHVERDLDELRRSATATDIERIKALRKRLDPNLEVVYGEYFDHQLNNVVSAVESGKITLVDVDEIRLLYKRMLPRFSNTEFWATSIPSRDYFWRDSALLATFNEFINKRHGKMTRIFFLTSDTPDAEALEVMKSQAEINVQVYYVPLSAVPKELNEMYLVGATQRIAWRVQIDAAKRITQVTATIDSGDVKTHREHFKRLLQLDATHKFEQAVATATVPPAH
jgi:hypothetical protein